MALAAGVITACKNDSKADSTEDGTTEQAQEAVATEVPNSTITLSPLTNSPAYAYAVLQLDTPETMVSPEAGDLLQTFIFIRISQNCYT